MQDKTGRADIKTRTEIKNPRREMPFSHREKPYNTNKAEKNGDEFKSIIRDR